MPPQPAPVVLPLDDKWRRGMPPRENYARGTASVHGSAPGGRRHPHGLPPAPPPPMPPGRRTSPWVAAAVAGGILLTVFVLVGCFGMAFLGGTSEVAPTAEYPPEPAATAELAPLVGEVPPADEMPPTEDETVPAEDESPSFPPPVDGLQPVPAAPEAPDPTVTG